MSILIYQDYVHNSGTLYRSLCRHFGTEAVNFCDAQDIIEGALNNGVSLFIMPGGADLYYIEKLNGAGNQAIKTYVENGGTYLGICAGAYYGCASVSWAENHKNMAIVGPRELGFFPGSAAGPVYSLFESENIEKSWSGITEIHYDDDKKNTDAHIFYEAGPLFEQSVIDNAGNIQVLARYASLPDNPAAIISCQVGAGKAILCSPHIECTADDLTRRLYKHKNASYGWEDSIANQLKAHESDGRKIWSFLLNHCLS